MDRHYGRPGSSEDPVLPLSTFNRRSRDQEYLCSRSDSSPPDRLLNLFPFSRVIMRVMTRAAFAMLMSSIASAGVIAASMPPPASQAAPPPAPGAVHDPVPEAAGKT